MWMDPLFGYLKNDSMFYKGWYQHKGSLSFDESVRRRRWKGWWNDEIVKLVRESMDHPTSLTVLLTGRGYSEFRHIITDMVERTGLKFDVLGFKPDRLSLPGQRDTLDKDQNTLNWNSYYGPSIIQKIGIMKYEELIRNETIMESSNVRVVTKDFKLAFMKELLRHHPSVSSIYLWDDRVHHVKSFQLFFDDLKLRGIVQEAIANTVFLPLRYFDPYQEYLVVQAMIDDHNKAVERFSTQADQSSR
ncbi:27340_t:CDS:1, partial [Racocetra persica]